MNSKLILKVFDRYQHFVKRRYLKESLHKLKVTDFSVISSNCWGGILYNDLKIPYQTPFVNMFMHAPCYIKLLQDFRAYIAKELVIVQRSKYKMELTDYPIGLLGDIEIHFIHYTLNDDVVGKWRVRVQRVNFEKLLFVLTERDFCSFENLEKFDTLSWPNKICFTAKEHGLKNEIHFPFWFSKEVLPADLIAGFTYKKLDVIAYLNHAFA